MSEIRRLKGWTAQLGDYSLEVHSVDISTAGLKFHATGIALSSGEVPVRAPWTLRNAAEVPVMHGESDNPKPMYVSKGCELIWDIPIKMGGATGWFLLSMMERAEGGTLSES